MKFALVLSIALAGIALAPKAAHAKDATTCKVATNDIGTIVGKGRNPSAAFEDAATKCFERRAQLYKMKKGTSVDEDSGLVMIDMCANIKCG